MSDDDEQVRHIAPRNVVSFLADLLAQDPAFQEQAAQIVETAKALARSGLVSHLVPVPGNLIQISASMNAALGERGPAIPPDVVIFAPAATAQGTTPSPSIRRSFTASGTVEEPKDDLVAKQSVGIGRIVAIVLVFIAASGLLGVDPAYQATVSYYAGIVGAALGIALAIWALPK